MSSHLYNKGATLSDGAFDYLDRAGLERQLATSRKDLQSVRSERVAAKERGPTRDGYEHMVPGAVERTVTQWKEKLEYLDSKIHYIECEIQVVERALYHLR